MNEAREAILQRIRQALGDANTEEAVLLREYRRTDR